jgi:hypothetical protein
MKSEKLRSCIAVVAIVGWGLFLPGCTYNRVQLPDGKTFAVERLPSSQLRVSWVHAEQRNHEMVIRGELTGGSSYARGTGHVDLAVIGSGGEILGKTSVGYAPKTIGRKGSARQPRFEAYFPFIPPDGSSIRVALHNDGGPAVGEIGYDCGNNRAAKVNQPG